MTNLRSWAPILRALGVVGAVVAITTGVTFASLQSQQAVLTGNSIQSASADLRIGTSTSSFANSRTGFTFKDLVPGGPAMPTDGNTFYLKNYGTATLTLKMSVPSAPTNTSGVDLTKVSILITRIDTGVTQTFSLQSLVDGYATGGSALTDSLSGGATAQYTLRASMAADAFSGASASLSTIDFVFSGSAVTG